MKIDRIASIALVLLGAWLFLSMSAWTHSTPQVLNTALVGAASFAMGFYSLRGKRWARWIAGALGVWLFISTWALPRRETMDAAAPLVSNLVVALLLFGFSILPAGEPARPRQRRTADLRLVYRRARA